MPQKIEKEAKFLVRGLENIENQLQAMGAVCTQPSTFEINLRFDNTEGTLSASFQVLRLRQDSRIRLTYKGPANPASTVSSRPEYEVEISDLETGRSILESLGYQVVTVYEKYRAAFQLGSAEISLDRMPFGDFIEIEGESESSIQLIANKLGLSWENRSTQSYMRLFDTAKKNLQLEMRDLTFENFQGLTVLPEHLHLQFAD